MTGSFPTLSTRDHLPGEPGSLTRKHYADLMLALGLPIEETGSGSADRSATGATQVDLTERERAFLVWLAGWDQPTVATAAGLLAKLTRTAVTR